MTKGKKVPKRRGRPAGATKLKARPTLDKLASTPGFDHLLKDAGTPGKPGSRGKASGGAFLMGLLVEGAIEQSGSVVSQREIKKAIRSRRRRLPKTT